MTALMQRIRRAILRNIHDADGELKDALEDLGISGGSGGLELISSVSITDPVEYVDVALPSGYDAFELIATDLAMDSGDSLAFGLSADAGATFFNDDVNFDSYTMFAINIGGDGGFTNFISSYRGGDALGLLMRSADDGGGVGEGNIPSEGRTVKATIYPGATGRTSSVLSFAGGDTGPGNIGPILSLARTYLADATGRQNLMRILPYGNGDCDPPTSDFQITAGSISLFGIPTP